jgi:hypothetical protein
MECKTRLPGTTDTADGDKFVEGQIEVDVLKIMLSNSAQADKGIFAQRNSAPY